MSRFCTHCFVFSSSSRHCFHRRRRRCRRNVVFIATVVVAVAAVAAVVVAVVVAVNQLICELLVRRKDGAVSVSGRTDTALADRRRDKVNNAAFSAAEGSP